MNNWMLDFEQKPCQVKAEPNDKFWVGGSCFAEHIGNFLQTYSYDMYVNPFGILYNPLSLVKCVKESLEKKQYNQSMLFEYGELWHSPAHHGSFSEVYPDKILNQINRSIAQSHQALLKAKFAIITFGSAEVFVDNKTGEIVGNCHKRPAADFHTRMLEVEEIVLEWQAVINQMPHLNFIFSISPVRYDKRGLEQNNLSKAILRLAIEKLLTNNPTCNYFAAYEWVTDVLRDYRFYEKDRVHPSAEAVSFVCQRFVEYLFSEQSRNYVEEYEKLLKLKSHRPLHPDTKAHQLFLEKLKEKEEAFGRKWKPGGN
jgi:lysophospholipase L1-like esterase